jgi:hypothetical protein
LSKTKSDIEQTRKISKLSVDKSKVEETKRFDRRWNQELLVDDDDECPRPEKIPIDVNEQPSLLDV